MSKSSSNTKVMAMSAMFTALITVATAFIKVPHPFGYTHAGDAFVYLSACNLPTPYGIIASALGGGLADLISGYPQWILPTMIIKSLNAVPFVLCRYFLKKSNKDIKIINIPNIIMLVPTTAITTLGYFVANYLIYGIGGAMAELAIWWVQPTMAAVLFVLIGLGLDALGFKQKMLPRLLR